MPEAHTDVAGAGAGIPRDAYFDQQAAFWDDVYSGTDVYSVIHQRRHATAVAWIARLPLAPGARVVDVGCGTGVTAVALARRGLEVTAVDAVQSMVERARRRADDAGVAERMTFAVQDAEALELADGEVDLVVALGVIPWLAEPESGLHEMARVTKEGGWIVVSADNSARLNYALDPWLNPRLASARAGIKRVAKTRNSGAGAKSQLHSTREFDSMLAAAGFEHEIAALLGFGPFTLLGQKLIPDALGIALDRRLQRLAARAPLLGARAAQYLVLGRRRAGEPRPVAP